MALEPIYDHRGCVFRLKNGRVINAHTPLVMGIINVSPDSFYKAQPDADAALGRAETLLQEGADILDIGAEATNPSVDIAARTHNWELEVARVLPVIKKLRDCFNHDVLISIDTSHPQVMKAAIHAGADIINDQRMLHMPGALETVADLQVPVCLMHFFHQGRVPGSESPSALLKRIKQELFMQAHRCQEAGIASDRIMIDPGFGQGNYAKNLEENYYLLNHLHELVDLGYPVLVGLSRKSMIGDLLGHSVEERLFGSIAIETLAVYQGAGIIRTHDPRAAWDVVRIVQQVRDAV